VSGTIVQKTADSRAKVFDTFEKAFKEGGFTVGTVRTAQGGMVIGDQPATKRHVVATIDSSHGQTVVTLTYRDGN